MGHAATTAILDDDAGVRAALASLLRAEGHAVQTFASPGDFLQAAGPDPDCLILDLQMPGMTGDALQARLLAEGRAIPAIFMTAFPQEAVRARVLAAGAVAFLEKPVDCDEIAALVAAVVADVAALGLLDDRAFADGRTASLRRKGGSRRKIALGLRAKGVDAETAAAALAAADIDEAEAALRLARRRRLGPWRVEPRSDDRAGRDRDIGVLVRQGFAYSLARQVIGMGLEEAEERLAGG